MLLIIALTPSREQGVKWANLSKKTNAEKKRLSPCSLSLTRENVGTAYLDVFNSIYAVMKNEGCRLRHCRSSAAPAAMESVLNDVEAQISSLN